jgi:excisionase family DNA binding protein
MTDHQTNGSTLPRYLTVSQVADRLQVSQRQVRRWLSDGSIGATRLGPHAIRIADNDLAHFLVTRRAPS